MKIIIVSLFSLVLMSSCSDRSLGRFPFISALDIETIQSTPTAPIGSERLKHLDLRPKNNELATGFYRYATAHEFQKNKWNTVSGVGFSMSSPNTYGPDCIGIVDANISTFIEGIPVYTKAKRYHSHMEY